MNEYQSSQATKAVGSLPLIGLAAGWLATALLLLAAGISQSAEGKPTLPDLESGFRSPPQSAKPLVWWHWINGNVTKEGIEADLVDMKRVGIAGAQMLDVSIYLPPGPVRYGTDSWHEHVQHAIKTADKLGLEFMMMNSPGWSASGGPWVKPERSMKKLVWSELEVAGGRDISEVLPRPFSKLSFYRDVAVIAVPADAPDENLLRTKHLKAATAGGMSSLAAAYDGNRATVVRFEPKGAAGAEDVRFDFDEPVSISQLGLMVAEAKDGFALKGAIEVAEDGENFDKIADIVVTDHEAATPAQCVIPFKPAKAKSVRLSLIATASGRRAPLALAEVSLGNPPRVDEWRMKIKMAETTLKRPAAIEPAVKEGVIARDQVLDLSKSLDATGRLHCKLPAGRWTLLRFGYTSTGSMNHPAVPEGHGLEIDKLDSDAVAFYFDRSLGRVIKEAGPLVGKSFTGILFDSFEGGPQNWTDSFPKQFRDLKGYDLTLYLPVLTGRIVESPVFSEAVLHDFRTAVEELIAKNYFGTMQRLANQHGLAIYAEAQGGPLNPVSCNEYVDVPMNEFWVPDASPRLPRIKLVASTANILGKKIVAAESFTAKPEDDSWRNSPATLKRSGDYAFTAGINRYILHYYAHQPVTEAAPGFTLGRYGTHFGRLNTWWPYADEWFKYVARCQFLLQQGRTVADVCFLMNEDFGYGYPTKMVDVPDGYDFDICYPQHLAKMEWKNGALSLPTGPAYRLLALPNAAWAADVATLRRVRELVNAGATILGEPPVAPAGLLDCLEGKSEFQGLVAELWDGIDGRNVKSKKLGKGAIYRGTQLADVLKNVGTAPDVSWTARTDGGEFRYIHRRSGDADIYFVFNHSERAVSSVFDFRSRDQQPELWNPATGTQVNAPAFAANTNGVSVPLQLEPYGSMFVVFRRALPARWAVTLSAGKSPGASQFSPNIGAGIEMFDGRLLASSDEQITVGFSDGKEETRPSSHFSTLPVNGPWRVGFPDGRGAPAEVAFDKLISWSEHSDPGVKYYSGTAVYRTRFELPPTFMRSNSVTLLDLGSVADIAEVRINGERAGVAWKPPFRLDVSRWLRAGKNELEVRVANQWVNRMIGDENIPVDYAYQIKGNKFTDGALQQLPSWLYGPAKNSQRKRQSFSTWKHYSADSPLIPSGLLGPVKLEQKVLLLHESGCKL